MAANGVGVPTQISLSGTGVTLVAGSGGVNSNGQNVYAVSLSLGGTNTVSVTAAAKDVAGNSANYTGVFNWVSYEINNATVAAATGNPIVVTAVAKGQAVVEISVPALDSDGTISVNSGKVYAQLLVTVGA